MAKDDIEPQQTHEPGAGVTAVARGPSGQCVDDNCVGLFSQAVGDFMHFIGQHHIPPEAFDPLGFEVEVEKGEFEYKVFLTGWTKP